MLPFRTGDRRHEKNELFQWVWKSLTGSLYKKEVVMVKKSVRKGAVIGAVMLISLLPITLFAQYQGWTNYTNGQWVRAVSVQGNKIWIGTNGGLVMLDTITGSMTFYNHANSGLPSNDVRSLAIDGSNIWIGTRGGGLAKFDGTNWTVYNRSNSGLPNDDVSSLAKDGNYIWIGTYGGGLAKFDGTNWTVYYTGNSNLPSNDVYALAIDRSNIGRSNIWIGTDGGGLAVYNTESGITEAKGNRLNSIMKVMPSLFKGKTTIRYELPDNENVDISVYNIMGQKVRTIVNGYRKAGYHTVRWDASGIKRGIYFIKFKSDKYEPTRKIVLK